MNNTINVQLSYDEQYNMIKLYDLLRDMDFELNDDTINVFDKIMESNQ